MTVSQETCQKHGDKRSGVEAADDGRRAYGGVGPLPIHTPEWVFLFFL